MKKFPLWNDIQKYITALCATLFITTNIAQAVLPNAETTNNPPSPQKTLQELDPSISKPKLKKDSCGIPVYPEVSKRNGDEGKVGLELHVSIDGDVLESKVVISSGFPELDAEAVKFISQCKFNPAQKNGVPVSVWYPIYHKWRLTPEGSDDLTPTDGNYTFKSQDNNSFSSFSDRACSSFVNELINNNWLHNLEKSQKPVSTEVCACLESKIRKDLILNKLYVKDAKDIKSFIDEEQLKAYIPRKTISYILSCTADSLDILAPTLELPKNQTNIKK